MEYENRHKKAFFIQTMIILGISLTALTAALLTGMLTMAAVFAVTLLFGLLKVRSLNRPRDVYRGTGSFVTAIILSLIICSITSPVISCFKFQYPFVYRSKATYLTENYIDKIPKGASGYYFESMPTILQGDGFYRLQFRANMEDIEELKKKCEADAISSFRVSEPDPETDNIRIYYSHLFSDHPEGTVYVFSYQPGNHACFMFILIDGDFVYCCRQ